MPPPASSAKNGFGAISRILFRANATTIISLEFARANSLVTRANTATSATYPRLLDGPPSRLFCLAPDWVFRAAAFTGERGGLLPHLFIMTARRAERAARLLIFCDTFHHRGLTRGAPA